MVVNKEGKKDESKKEEWRYIAGREGRLVEEVYVR